MRVVSIAFFITILSLSKVFAQQIDTDIPPYICGESSIHGQLLTNDPEHTTLTIILSQS